MEQLLKLYEKARCDDPLLDRAFMFIEDNEPDQAKEYFEKVLDAKPRCTFAYLGRIQLVAGYNTPAELFEHPEEFVANADYEKAIRFADDELRGIIEGITSTESEKTKAYAIADAAMNRCASREDTVMLIEAFSALPGFRDSDERADMLRDVLSLIDYCTTGADVVLEEMQRELDRKYTEAKDVLEAERQSAQKLKATMEKNLAEISELVNKTDAMKAELRSLNIFQGKRKKELKELILASESRIFSLRRGKDQDEERYKKALTRISEIEAVISNYEKDAKNAPAVSDTSKDIDSEVSGDVTASTPSADIDEARAIELIGKTDILKIAARIEKPLVYILTNDKLFRAAVENEELASAIAASPHVTAYADLFSAKILGNANLYNQVGTETLRAALSGVIAVGKTVTLGKIGKNGKRNEDIRWMVTESLGGGIYELMSMKPIANLPFDMNYATRPWAECSLRRWMNGDFMKKHLNWNESGLIVPTRVSDGKQFSNDYIYIPNTQEIARMNSLVMVDYNSAWLRYDVRFYHQPAPAPSKDPYYVQPVECDYYYVKRYENGTVKETSYGSGNAPIFAVMRIKI